MVRVYNAERQRVRALTKGKLRGVSGTGADNPWNNPDSTRYFDKVLAQKEYEDVFSRHNISADSIVSEGSNGQKVLYFENYIYVTYKKGTEEPGYLLYSHESRKLYYPRSYASLLSGTPVAIEKNGTCLPPTEFFSSGYWSWSEKISHLLPADYDETTGR